MQNNEKDFITIKEAAKLLGITRNTLHVWIKKDQEIKENNLPKPKNFKCPPYGRIGNLYKLRREDIKKFMDEYKDS